VGSLDQPWRFERVGRNCGLIGPNAAVVVGQTAFWASPDRQFYRYPLGGQPEPIACPIRQDFAGFAKTELVHRREVGLPPFARMVRIVLRDDDQPRLHKRSEDLAAKLAEAVARERGEVQTKGPMPCAISRIAGHYRNQIVMLAATPGPLQRVLAAVRDKGGLTKGEKVAVDVDPVSLL